ncbi:MAG: hypothetical protein HYZ37_05560 [Candidatus Solibacter usitatus]|nr:hypothetical protein [Candidatus Solibacter usitatus]
MTKNLEALAREIPEYLRAKGLAVFRGLVNELHEQRLVFWDVDSHSDYKEFADCAVQAGVKLMIFNHKEFKRAMAEDALESMEESDMPLDEQRSVGRRIKELFAYDGFTCAVELVFEVGNRFYVYDLRTKWYEELLDLMDTIDMPDPFSGDGEEGAEPMGGYYSRN